MTGRLRWCCQCSAHDEDQRTGQWQAWSLSTAAVLRVEGLCSELAPTAIARPAVHSSRLSPDENASPSRSLGGSRTGKFGLKFTATVWMVAGVKSWTGRSEGYQESGCATIVRRTGIPERKLPSFTCSLPVQTWRFCGSGAGLKLARGDRADLCCCCLDPDCRPVLVACCAEMLSGWSPEDRK